MKLVLVSEDVSRISSKRGDAEAILSWKENIQKNNEAGISMPLGVVSRCIGTSGSPGVNGVGCTSLNVFIKW